MELNKYIGRIFKHGKRSTYYFKIVGFEDDMMICKSLNDDNKILKDRISSFLNSLELGDGRHDYIWVKSPNDYKWDKLKRRMIEAT